LSYGSYYASAAAWAWDHTWLFGVGKLAWSVTVALVSGVITALVVRKLKGNWFPGLVGGVAGTVGGALLVLLGVFVFNLVRYPVIHEAELHRPHRLGLGAAYAIFYAWPPRGVGACYCASAEPHAAPSAVASDHSLRHAGAGGARSPAISDRISLNI
jgi:hypothetical protein